MATAGERYWLGGDRACARLGPAGTYTRLVGANIRLALFAQGKRAHERADFRMPTGSARPPLGYIVSMGGKLNEASGLLNRFQRIALPLHRLFRSLDEPQAHAE